jgi:mannose-1-phosphate guanylyltransferase/phosphomannomutase
MNVGIGPQVAVRLGMAYGTILKRGSVVVTGRDASRAARTMKRAIIAGLNSSGVTVHDLELVPLPLTRFTVGAEQASGGISVRTSPRDPEIVEIRLFDGDGGDLAQAAQRKIERVFYREDYRRASPSKLGELEFPPRALEQYTAGLIRALDIDAIRTFAPKVVVDYAFGPASLVGPSLLGRLGCDVLAVNAFTDEHRPVLVAEDLERLLRDLSDHVRKSGSDLGVLLEPGGEVAHLVDDQGRRIDGQNALLAFLRHEANRGASAVAVPVSSSRVCEELVAPTSATLHWTPVAPSALMAWAERPGVGFAGDADGILIFPDFMPAPDALMTFGKALELVAVRKEPLSSIVNELPEVHIARREVRTPWERKGAVMRHVASVAAAGGGSSEIVLLDGVKVVAGGNWTLVIPYPDEPMCGIWAEASDPETAEELADRMAKIVAEAAETAAAADE